MKLKFMTLILILMFCVNVIPMAVSATEKWTDTYIDIFEPLIEEPRYDVSYNRCIIFIDSDYYMKQGGIPLKAWLCTGKDTLSFRHLKFEVYRCNSDGSKERIFYKRKLTNFFNSDLASTKCKLLFPGVYDLKISYDGCPIDYMHKCEITVKMFVRFIDNLT